MKKSPLLIIFLLMGVLMFCWQCGTKGKAYGEDDVIYSGNVESLKYHRPGCQYYGCMVCTKKFKSREEAIDAGYKPCGKCKP